MHGWLKINVDGAIDSMLALAGTGIVIRDAEGQFCKGVCRKYRALNDPFTLELTACRDAMVLAMDSGYTHTLLEIDYQSVANAWLRGEDRSVGGQLIREMRIYLPHV